MNYIIRYGNPQISLDVTQLTFDKCMKNNVIRIPRGEAQKNALFTDPDKDQVKVINIYNLLTHSLSVHDDSKDVYILAMIPMSDPRQESGHLKKPRSDRESLFLTGSISTIPIPIRFPPRSGMSDFSRK